MKYESFILILSPAFKLRIFKEGGAFEFDFLF